MSILKAHPTAQTARMAPAISEASAVSSWNTGKSIVTTCDTVHDPLHVTVTGFMEQQAQGSERCPCETAQEPPIQGP